jgi:hypothetical protein
MSKIAPSARLWEEITLPRTARDLRQWARRLEVLDFDVV